MNDLNDLMKQAQAMQQKMQDMQKEMGNAEVEGQAGAGLVKVVMNGRHDVLRVAIDPDLLKEEVKVLEDLLAAAVNDAVRRVEEANREQMAKATGGLFPPGFKMPF